MELTIDGLRPSLKDDAAIRGTAILQPAGGNGEKLFPPTHSVDEKRLRPDERLGAKYAWEKRRIEGQVRDVVLLDSVQSQANRMEEALYALWADQSINLPVVVVDFEKDFPDLGRSISSLTAPHRISDALLRDSLLDGTLFRHSSLGQSFVDATVRSAAPLFRLCPTALVFGLWDSSGPKGGLGFKLARNLTSEIVAIDTVFGAKSSSRIDPAGIMKDAGRLFEANDPKEQWTLDPGQARMSDVEKSKKKDDAKETKAKEPSPLLFKDDGKPSSANHGNIPPDVDVIAGGITCGYAKQTVVLSLAGLRRLSFGTREESEAAHTVLAALGLLAAVASADRGYDLRSRCQLVPESGKSLAFETVGKNGDVRPFTLNLEQARKLYSAAVDALPKSIQWTCKDGEPLATLTPTPKLVRLIQESRRLAAAGESEEEE